MGEKNYLKCQWLQSETQHTYCIAFRVPMMQSSKEKVTTAIGKSPSSVQWRHTAVIYRILQSHSWQFQSSFFAQLRCTIITRIPSGMEHGKWMNEIQTSPRSVTDYKNELGFVKTLVQLKTTVERPKRWGDNGELINKSIKWTWSFSRYAFV